MVRTPAWKRYNMRVIWLSLLYCAFLLPAVYGFKHQIIPGPLKYIVAILPALPIIGIFASWGRYLSDERDEYHQALTLRRIAIATNATMGAAVVWGFLQAFGVMPLVETYWIPFVWVVCQGASACVAVLTRGRIAA